MRIQLDTNLVIDIIEDHPPYAFQTAQFFNYALKMTMSYLSLLTQ